MCDGAPSCVSACPTGALRHITSANILQRGRRWKTCSRPDLAGCQGCNTELLMRTPCAASALTPCWRRRRAVSGMGSVGYNGLTGTKVPVFQPPADQHRRDAGGVKRQLKRKGREVTAIAIPATAAHPTSLPVALRAAERGEELLFMVVDNEGYMNRACSARAVRPMAHGHRQPRLGRESKGKTQDARTYPS